MNVVYVVCEPTSKLGGSEVKSMDLTPAAKFGYFEVLCPTSQSLLAPVPTVRMLKEKLRNFTDDDYILPVGDPVLMSTVSMVAAAQNGGRVKFLKWDRKLREYYSIQVDISGKAL